MGMCCCGTSGEPSDARTCAEIGCDYFADSGASCLGNQVGGCAFVKLLTAYLEEKANDDAVLLAVAGGTYTALYDLRDEILTNSDSGRRILDHYVRFSPLAAELARDDPDLQQEALRVLLVGASFGRAMLRELHGRGEAVGPRTFRREAYESLERLIRTFAERIADKDFQAAGDQLLETVRLFVGMSPSEVLASMLDKR